MRKVLAVMVLAVSFVSVSYGQSCDAVVSDNANILGSGLADVQKAGTSLIDQGVDPHFITTSAASSSLEQQVASLKTTCSNWQSPNHGVKANILVFMVAPKERKMAIFYGPGYGAALEGQTDRIKRDFMAPRFKGGDWAGGFVAAAQAVNGRIKASLDESNKPVTYTNTTTNQATDFHGLWVFFWIVGGLLFGIVVLIVYFAIKRSKDDADKAQQDAIAARGRVVDLLSTVQDSLTEYSDLTIAPLNVRTAASLYDRASAEFSKLAGSIAGDPSEMGLGEATYSSLQETYERLEGKLSRAVNLISSGGEMVEEPPKKPAATVAPVQPTQPIEPTQPTKVVEREVIHDNSNDFATGVILGDMLGSREREPERVREPEPEPVHHHHHSDDDSSSSSSSSSSDFGGSSSSWSDSSSSWSDSGSSSFGGDSGGGFGGDSSSF